jgi:hypothetical protein
MSTKTVFEGLASAKTGADSTTTTSWVGVSFLMDKAAASPPSPAPMITMFKGMLRIGMFVIEFLDTFQTANMIDVTCFVVLVLSL